MQFSLRLMLVALTLTAGVSGYLRWRVHEQRRDHERYVEPGPVEKRKYWPPPAEKFLGRIEAELGPRDDLRLYRNLYHRRYGMTDCFVQMKMSGEEFAELVALLKLEPLAPRDRMVRRFWKKAPAEWLTPNDVAGADLYGEPYIRGGRMGDQPVLVYEDARGRANLWFVYDF